MSAGQFARSRYQANNGDIHPIRVQPETLLANIGAVNAAPTASVDVPLFARARKSRRAFGLGARSVRVQFTGQPPTGYAENQVLTIPILTQAVFNQITVDQAGTYLSSPIVVIGTSEESRR